MPQDFDNCRAKGGKIRTVSGPNKEYSLADGEYIHICVQGNKIIRGEKKVKHHLSKILTKTR